MFDLNVWKITIEKKEGILMYTVLSCDLCRQWASMYTPTLIILNVDCGKF